MKWMLKGAILAGNQHHRILSVPLFIAGFLSVLPVVPKGEVLGVTNEIYFSADTTKHTQQVTTTTAFEQTEAVEYEPVPFDIVYREDPQTEYGVETIVEKGADGTKALTYLVTHWENNVIDRRLVGTKVTAPRTQIVSKGTKIVWKILETPDAGTVKYWRKMRVWATKYDHTCPGCNYTTAVGAYLQKGVCATDPKVIPLWTSFYIPGYGKCTALDVGGAIKGAKIDMAYEDAAKAAWGAGWKDIYLMDNLPE
ncbi:MAG: hypothetical protein UX69_C0001G0011 [candidate division WWE3 bacterium GW2011_GWA2_46_9]|uniref:G5 domain-containing protein n=2 Tax=Katanobacteria TaxID=422282 RepID=A0A0G1QWZ1_UNCKA|nr:MAG: hypothetical protein UX69_C0001G0011 [candidate division WWE3 bacterium GW2011_GWA2_46_9]KKU51408.1 MAG: hypothetical protein UX73_C0002G0008 [candidate division WWE3 bacterium GW2011_GWC1_47_10]